MRYSLLDIICCPVDRHTPLNLLVLEEKADDIVSGILLCEQCGRWYAIMQGVPHLVRDGLRLVGDEAAFLEYFAKRLPDNARDWKPFGLEAKF
jgi:uncharacterized protein YbaR (Trm112 family)